MDLEAAPKFDKDTPPDLKALADSLTPGPGADTEEEGAAAAEQPSAAPRDGAAAAAAAAPAAASKASSGKKSKASSGGGGGGAAAAAVQGDAIKHVAAANVGERTEELINRVRAARHGRQPAGPNLAGWHSA